MVFSEVRNQDFVHLDDDRNIYNNSLLNPATSSNVIRFWSHAYADTYRPIVYTAWALISLAERNDAPQAVFGTGEVTTLKPGVGLVFFKQGKTTQAIEQYQQALRLQPDYAPAQSALQQATH